MPTSARLATVERIQNIYKKLTTEALVSEELEELVRLTSDLHESAVILRYKAAEERVFDKPKTEKPIEPEVSKPVEKEVVEEVKEKPSAIDFSIFDQTEKEVQPSEKVEKVAAEREEPKLDFSSPAEEKGEEIVEPVIESPSNEGGWSTYFDKVLQDHASGIQTPLSALSGSFGLNERILYINQLFNKEAETFSELIQKLDEVSDWGNCVNVLSNEATNRNWDKENDTTGEFILHVKRRYV